MSVVDASLFLLPAALSVAIWFYLLAFRGSFWRDGPYLESAQSLPTVWPEVVAVVPARNEAEAVGATIASLCAQDYPGPFSIVLVDDQSEDGTAAYARAAAGSSARVRIMTGNPLPPGWTGKMWAVAQGLDEASRTARDARYIWLTDGDIVHQASVLRTLVAKAEQEDMGLVSQMVLLRCATPWERLLIPAFVFFFKKLFPFPWVNDRRHRMAAAAGGCILVRKSALESIGGIACIKGEIIDDCALARAIKRHQPIWLGLTRASVSLRRYDRLADIWSMVARTAFVQLRYSLVLLVGTVLGMTVLYISPPAAVVVALANGSAPLALIGLAGCLMMVFAYRPTLRLCGVSTMQSCLLPFAALLYTLMTIASAWRSLSGQGPSWKDRRYARGMGTS